MLAEIQRRANQRTKLDASKLLFGQQLAFATDESHNIAACCSRRAGKSHAVAFRLLMGAMKFPRSICLYVVQSRESAKDIIWRPLLKLNDELDLGLQFRENDGNVILPNGSKILLKGAGNKREIDKLRGMTYPVVAIDEAQTFGTELLKYLLEEIVEPGTLDYGQHGQVILTGTPNAACAGFFHEVTAKGLHGWSVHSWTLLDNPHLPDAADWLLKKRERSGWDEKHPAYLREYCGVWVRDTEGMVYAFDDKRNVVPELPYAHDWEYVLGLDLGFNDPTAFVVMAYSEMLQKCVVVESWKESDLIPSRVAVEVEQLIEEYDISRVVADTGGFGKGYVEEMREKHQMAIIPARKRDKAAFVEMLNGDLRTGALSMTPSNTDLKSEIQVLQWDADRLAASGKLVEDSRYENHLCDAMLYAWRECKHHGGDWEHNVPAYGSPEWEALEEKRMEEQALRQYEDSLNRTWWDPGGLIQ